MSLISSLAWAQFEPPEPIELKNARGETWVIQAAENYPGRIQFSYRYQRERLNSILLTGLSSEHHPSAVLFEGLPFLVFTSFDGSDEDVYFVRWQDGGWSDPERVHPDNGMPDMEPEVTLSAAAITVSWKQNTGTTLVEKSAEFDAKGGSFFSAAPWLYQQAVAYSSGTGAFYTSMTPRDETEPLRCIAFGDSITSGYKRDASGNIWGVTWSPNGGRYGGYTEELESLMSEMPSPIVYNWGIPGDLSSGGLERIDAVMSRHSDANCILIMFGANDAIHKLNTSSVASNILSMAIRARSAGKVPIVATITPNTKSADVRPYNSKIVSMVDEQGLTLADQYTKMIDNGWPHTGDGLHVSYYGDGLMAEEWFHAMQENGVMFPSSSSINIVPILQLLLLDD